MLQRASPKTFANAQIPPAEPATYDGNKNDADPDRTLKSIFFVLFTMAPILVTSPALS